MAEKIILGNIIKERKIMEKIIKPDIKGEMDEFQRLSQDIRRDEKIDISVEELVRSFDGLKEQTLTDDVWPKLENTESNEIEKGDIDAVNHIAKLYNKTNPKKLIKAIKSGDYHRPLILKMGKRYILIAGNTRLCTAAAMGINPKVFIGEIEEGKKVETKEQTTSASSGAFAPAMTITKREIYKLHNANLKEDVEIGEATDSSSSGSYDAPLFGKTPKGNKNPLKIDGIDSVRKSRAVTDKKFPKWGGPEAVYIKIKDKCKKFPYCNQGDINAIELLEMNEIKEAIRETSKKSGLTYKQVENIVLNDISKIFI